MGIMVVPISYGCCEGFSGSSVVKNLPANAGDRRDMGSDSWVGMIPWRRKWQPTPVFLPGKSHGQRSMAGYSLRGHKESDTTQQLNNNNMVFVRIK